MFPFFFFLSLNHFSFEKCNRCLLKRSGPYSELVQASKFLVYSVCGVPLLLNCHTLFKFLRDLQTEANQRQLIYFIQSQVLQIKFFPSWKIHLRPGQHNNQHPTHTCLTGTHNLTICFTRQASCFPF